MTKQEKYTIRHNLEKILNTYEKGSRRCKSRAEDEIYTGICVVHIRLNQFLKSFESTNIYLEKHLPKKRDLMGYAWSPRRKEARMRWLKKHIELLKT